MHRISMLQNRHFQQENINFVEKKSVGETNMKKSMPIHPEGTCYYCFSDAGISRLAIK